MKEHYSILILLSLEAFKQWKLLMPHFKFAKVAIMTGDDEETLLLQN